MKPTTSQRWLGRTAGTALVLLGLAWTVGCAHVNNPCVDSGALVEPDMTTSSAEGYRTVAGASEQVAFTAARRTWPTSTVYQENGAVSHWPIWFEDPFIDKGNGCTPADDRDAPDTDFAWNWVDCLHIGYGPGRMVFVNTAGWPISAVVTPPGTLMESDGRIDKNVLGYDHDAKRSDSVTREPPDVNILKKQNAAPIDLTTAEEEQPAS